MKRFFIVLTAFLFLGCAISHQATVKTEIPKKLWEDISKDLAYLYALVESINKNLERERSLLKVEAEPWEYPMGKTVTMWKPSKKIEYPIIKYAGAKVPTETGFVDAEIIKAKGKKGLLWFAAEKQAKFPKLLTAYAGFEPILWKGEKIPLYTYGALMNKSKAVPAIKQFVLFDGLIDKAFEEVNKALRLIQKKYKESPIYVDGFTVHIGINFSIDINFKIRR